MPHHPFSVLFCLALPWETDPCTSWAPLPSCCWSALPKGKPQHETGGWGKTEMNKFLSHFLSPWGTMVLGVAMSWHCGSYDGVPPPPWVHLSVHSDNTIPTFCPSIFPLLWSRDASTFFLGASNRAHTFVSNLSIKSLFRWTIIRVRFCFLSWPYYKYCFKMLCLSGDP